MSYGPPLVNAWDGDATLRQRAAGGQGRRASSRGLDLVAPPRVQQVPQPRAEHVDGQDRPGQEDGREEDVVREDPEQGAAFGHDVAPGRGFRRDADAEEREDRLQQDRRGADERALHHEGGDGVGKRSEEHTSELQSLAYLVCRLLLEKKKKKQQER